MQAARSRPCRLAFRLVQIMLLFWLESAEGRAHLHAESEGTNYREVQLPGFVKVTLSGKNGLSIGPHRFKPLHGSLAFSLIQVRDRWYYEVIEQMPERIRASYVDAVTGVLTDPRTGFAITGEENLQ